MSGHILLRVVRRPPIASPKRRPPHGYGVPSSALAGVTDAVSIDVELAGILHRRAIVARVAIQVPIGVECL